MPFEASLDENLLTLSYIDPGTIRTLNIYHHISDQKVVKMKIRDPLGHALFSGSELYGDQFLKSSSHHLPSQFHHVTSRHQAAGLSDIKLCQFVILNPGFEYKMPHSRFLQDSDRSLGLPFHPCSQCYLISTSEDLLLRWGCCTQPQRKGIHIMRSLSQPIPLHLMASLRSTFIISLHCQLSLTAMTGQ